MKAERLPDRDSQPYPSWRRRAITRGWSCLRFMLVLYLSVVLMLLFLENMLVYPARKFPAGDWQPAGLGQTEVNFKSADGTALHGWLVEAPQPRAHVLLFHGNGEHVADLAELLRYLRDVQHVSVFAIDYRCYGRSAGKPNEKGVIEDGHAAHDWLRVNAGLKPEDIVLMGRSLGAAVAIDVASVHGARGLIMEGSFTTMPDAASHIYPFIPVRWLMRNRYDSIDKITRYHGPLLQIHGIDDEIVPVALGEKLFAAAPSENKTLLKIPHRGHNDLWLDDYAPQLTKFLESLPANPEDEEH